MPYRARNSAGQTIVGMRISAPGSNDLISHTLRHFISSSSHDMGPLPPPDAITPAAARTCLLIEGDVPDADLDALPITSAQPLAAVWWHSPRRELVEDIHDQGYWPRYRDAFLAAPSPAKWHRESNRKVKYRSQGGCFLCGIWREDKAELQITSAYRRLTGGGGPSAISQDSSDQVLRDILRQIQR